MVLSHSRYKTFIPRESADWPPARYTVWPSRRTAARFEWLVAHRPSRCVRLAYQSGHAAPGASVHGVTHGLHRRGLAHRRVAKLGHGRCALPTARAHHHRSPQPSQSVHPASRAPTGMLPRARTDSAWPCLVPV